MVALFDHEEVGSNSAQGAGSPVMLDALSRITSSFDSDSKVHLFLLQERISYSFNFIHVIIMSLFSKCYRFIRNSFSFHFVGSCFIHVS